MTLSTVNNKIQKAIIPIAKRLLNPQKLSFVATKFPSRINSSIMEKLCNQAFNDQIKEGEFEFLKDNQLQIEILDAQLFIGLSYQNNKIICTHFNQQPTESDVTLSVSSLDAISLIQQQVDPDTLFFQRKLKIKGNTDLAHQVKNTIDTLDPNVIPKLALNLIAQYKRLILQ